MKTEYNMTLYALGLIEWVRFVLLPPFIALSGDKAEHGYLNLSPELKNTSIIIMIFEFITVFIFLIFILKSKNKQKCKDSQSNLLFKGNLVIYNLFIILSLIIMVGYNRTYKFVNFIFLPLTGGRVSNLSNSMLIFYRQIIIIGLMLLFMIIVSKCSYCYRRNNKLRYINIAVFAAIINVIVIIGESRLNQIYTALFCIWVLSREFPEHKTRIISSVGFVATIVILLLSIYKFFFAFKSNSYLEALTSSNISLSWITRTIQNYFFGPENLALSIEFGDKFNFNFNNLILDFARSTFGLNFILRDKILVISQLFNIFIYKQEILTGHLLSSAGYSYIFFGVLLSPIFTIVNISIAMLFEQKLRNTRYYELTCLFGLIFFRVLSNLFSNPNTWVNYSTTLIGTFGLLFLVSIIVEILKINLR